jgi:hypothetical protein
MEQMPSTPRTRKILKRDDISSGMGVVQTVYGVGMALGLKNVLEASYRVFFLPVTKSPDTIPRWAIPFAFVAVVLLAIRFFWVPRNLYSYLIRPHDEADTEDRFRKLTLFHIPIVMAHAVLFFFICHAFADMASPEAPSNATGAQLAVRFVAMYGGLLLLNTLWLFWMTPRPERGKDAEPGRIWARSNMVAVGLTLLLLGAFYLWRISPGALVVAAALIFIANGFYDLVRCAKFYILFEPLPPAVDGEGNAASLPELA